MAGHNWHSRGFVHGAPGAMDCWDQRVSCGKCGTNAVLLNQVDTRAVKEPVYDSKVKGKTDSSWRAAVDALRPHDYVENDCDQIVVDQVHAL